MKKLIERIFKRQIIFLDKHTFDAMQHSAADAKGKFFWENPIRIYRVENGFVLNFDSEIHVFECKKNLLSKIEKLIDECKGEKQRED